MRSDQGPNVGPSARTLLWRGHYSNAGWLSTLTEPTIHDRLIWRMRPTGATVTPYRPTRLTITSNEQDRRLSQEGSEPSESGG
jgi:hypothetical protein